MSSTHQQSIRYVKGVGPQRMNQLARLGIQTVEDACYYPPRRYEDRAHLVSIHNAKPGEVVTVRGMVKARGLRRIRGGQTIFEIALKDRSGALQGTWFNQPYLARQVNVGDELILYGKMEPGLRPQMVHPEMERVEGNEETSLHVGRIVPIYPLTTGMTQRWFRQVIAAVLDHYAGKLLDPLPGYLRDARGWSQLSTAIHELHFPTSWEALVSAQQRLAFEELLVLQLALAQRKASVVRQMKAQRYQLDGPLTEGLRRRLPFALTGAQQRVLEELLGEMQQPYPMQRLLQGDVGCGKTIVMIWLIAVAVQSGYQAALMAPTELLAEQHARVIASYLEPLGVCIGLLSQRIAPTQRRQIADGLSSGALDIGIGTHALLREQVAFQRLSLVIIDEQHKFGVTQRAHLVKKAEMPDVLVVTATPIPRTMALSIYGDLSFSTITELPPGRGPVDTRWIREAERQALYAMIREQLARGRQGYVVYPLVDRSGAVDGARPDGGGGVEVEQESESQRDRDDDQAAPKALKAATQMARQLQSVFREFQIGLLHGQMKAAEKERIMLSFARGDIQLLVSTVIVEVGLDVPNATIMVIEHPERFGLAQLHQLRGRVGRGSHAAVCIVIGDAEEDAVRQRLEAFVRTTNGFELAERDLELRGPGQLLGRQQHGWLRFRIASLARDRTLLESAREEALALTQADPQLRAPELAVLRTRLGRFRKQPHAPAAQGQELQPA